MATSNSANKARSRGRGRRVGVIAAVIAVFALAFAGLIFANPAFADARSDAVNDKLESEQRISSLKGEIEGIDQELADLFVAVEQSKIEVADLQIDLADAEQVLADAERKHAALEAQLADAIALKNELEETIQASSEKEDELQVAVGAMAREMYRGETLSPFSVVVGSDDLGEISSRAAAASALTRAQSKAMDEVRTGLVVSQNQAEKQEAVTERITDLEAKAEEAKVQAAEARDQVADSLQAVEVKLSEQQALQAEWEIKQAEAKVQLETANEDLAAAAARIAAIDKKAEEDRLAAEAAAAKKAEEDAKKAQQQAGSSKPQTSKPSTSTPAPSSPSNSNSSSGSALFRHPFNFQARVTSYFGWRLHPILGYYRLHNGTDFGAGCGTTQVATRGGTVVAAGWDSGAGNYVSINHGSVNGHSYITQHLHLSQILVSKGQSISSGTPIGLTGSTGMSTGCHLHLTLYRDGTPVSILPYM